MDSDNYVEAIAAGDPDAFGRWVACVELPIRRQLARFATTVDTEAVMQETLLRVWNVAPRFERRDEPDGLMRLALRIARNLAISETRRKQPERMNPDAEELTGHPVNPDPHLRKIIQACREQLPRQPKAAIEARLEGAGTRPDRALAEQIGMRLNTFLQNVTRARRLLARCLKKNGVDLDLELS